MTNNSELWLKLLCGIAVGTMVGCSSMKTPATAEVAVSKAAVESAASAGGAQYAPLEMRSAREKLDKAKKALADKEFELAADLANQAEADAKLAQSKAGSAKAKVAADAIDDDIRVLREELKRSRQ
ncbi:MAG: hypothetical protein CVU33_18755 [Betaproteobacteria bacterium HGW-Betaproteobacteria-6]|jgi:hypothetical protein|nr:MAG: hypothetical protein CVU33_18755 [Betaproteobacteria bacterium HGW-Betaproteobacteria-6]